MKTKNYCHMILLLLAGAAAPIHSRAEVGQVLPDGRIIIGEMTSRDDSIAELQPVTAWDYSGPVLGSFAEGEGANVTSGLQVTFKFNCLSTLGHDLKLGAAIIGDQLRGRDAAIAGVMKRNPACFYAAVGEAPAPLPDDEAERLANAQAEGPGFFQRPSSYLGMLGGAGAVYLAQDQLGGGGSDKGHAINIEGNGNAVSTGRGNASADNSSTQNPVEVIRVP